jgi:DNA polymerase-3 subunit epsilon
MIELAWVWANASADPKSLAIESRLIALPDDTFIPGRVTEMTGLRAEDLVLAPSPSEVRSHFLAQLSGAEDAPAIIHYAQFEKPFLLSFLELTETLPFEVFCTHQLSKKLFPHLPSRNIRGVSGFFGSRISDLRRASSHVMATVEIWRGLVTEFERVGVMGLDDVRSFLKIAPKVKSPRYEYRVDKEKRLRLPNRPGVYRMLAKSGEILYVGKATSLKDRVNSYFRGKRGRDKRKLELMAQVWDLNVTECRTALEAAVLESDEIKRLDPPYNVSLKKGKRRLLFYSRDFAEVSATQSERCPIGPFKPFNSIERMVALSESLRSPIFRQIFHELFDAEDLAEAYQLFCDRHQLDHQEPLSVRELLAIGMKLLRQQLASASREEIDETLAEAALSDEANESESGDVDSDDASVVEPENIGPEELADKFERHFIRAAKELRRAKRLTKLLNAKVRWHCNETWEELTLSHGSLIREDVSASSEPVELKEAESKEAPRFPWSGLEIADYDRMSVLFSELSKYPHEIKSLSS